MGRLHAPSSSLVFLSIQMLFKPTTAQPFGSQITASEDKTTSNHLVTSSDPFIRDDSHSYLRPHMHVRRNSDDDNPSNAKNPANYYFIFIALFVFLVFIGLWSGRRRQQRRKAIAMERRQSALQQDASGWPTSRRWLHGRGGQNDDIREYYYREEGLDARGEAPPPYQPGGAPAAPPNDPAHLRVPPPALTRDSPHKPPEYQASVSAVETPERHDVRLDDSAPGTSTSSPQTAESHART